MQTQEYILKNKKDFNSTHIFECGQCFRWNVQENGTYIGVIKDAVIEVIEEKERVIFRGVSNSDRKLEEIVKEYFNLDTDYSEIKSNLSKVDEYLKASIEYGNGIRILKQDIFETIISFIISANNNIPRIKSIVEKVAKTYGKKIEYNQKEYYLFPTAEELSKASVEDLRKLGMGFRDKRVYTTTKMLLNGQASIASLEKLEKTDDIREELLKLDGVGPKVADCILLFGFNRYDVFPIDVWVRRVMNDLYIKNEQESKVSKIEIKKLAEGKYGKLQGLAQQYLFYWKRDQGTSGTNGTKRDT